MNFEAITTTCLNDEDSPWIPLFEGTDDVAVKYFNIDPIHGQVVLLAKNKPGVVQPRHHHTGSVIVYTVKGSWKYAEHGWVAREGSVVYETACSEHTPIILDDEVIALNILQGELLFLDDADQIVGVETWRTHFDRYLRFCRENNIEPRDFTSFHSDSCEVEC